MTSTWFGKDTWRAADQGEGAEYSGGSGSDGGWPALGGLVATKAGVKGSPPKKDFGPVGAERKFGLVKPVMGSPVKVSGGGSSGGAGAIAKSGGAGGGGPHERAWKEMLKASANPGVPLGKSLLSVEGAGRSRTTSAIMGARQSDRDEEKGKYPPGLWGALGMKITKEPGELGHGVSSKLIWGHDLLRSNEVLGHVREAGFYPMGMGGAVAGQPKYSDSAPYGGRSPLINESYGFSSLAGPSTNRCDGSCLSRINDAYLEGFLAGRRSMVMQPLLPSMPSLIPPGGSNLLDFHEPARNSGLHSLFSGSAAKPPTTFTSQQGRWFEALSHDNFKNFVPVTPLKLAQADGVAFGAGCELGDGASSMTYSRSSSGDGGYQLPESGLNSWSDSCAAPVKGESDPLKR